MAFADALQMVLGFVGGYDPDDPGGPKNKGINQKTYDAFRARDGKPKQAVLHIEPDEVERILRRSFWVDSGADLLPGKLATIIFDTAVDMDVKYARLYVIASGYPKSADELTACKTVLALRQGRYDHLCDVNPANKASRHKRQVRLLKLAHFAGVTL